MSELINKYNEDKDKLLELLAEFFPKQELFLESPGRWQTLRLRTQIRKIRKLLHEMYRNSAEIRNEKTKNFLEAHPVRAAYSLSLRKPKNVNDTTNQ